MMSFLKRLYSSRAFECSLLLVIASITIIYSFTLANKRYNNFEYGKFDLGNMVQMIYNTSQGRFMEVTDQFGTNMPRWGMSHVDPILVIFVPLFYLLPHPMMPVFFQHVLIVSAIFPLYFLFKNKLKDKISALIFILVYLMYPANGFTLVWTTYHGISFVAPILIWLIWFLDKKDYFNKKYSIIDLVTYWVLIIVMLLGKEEVGAILGLTGIYIWYKSGRNLKLNLSNVGTKIGLSTIIIGFLWTFICFYLIIPSYSDERTKSVVNFVKDVDAFSAKPENASGKNFFLMRYSYLGNSYTEILTNMIIRPSIWTKEVFTEDKMDAVNAMLGPLGYITILSPFWLVSLPDVIIVLFSKDEIFNINNHRIAFITVSLFLSYLFVISFIFNRAKLGKHKVIILRSIMSVTLVLTFYFAFAFANPLFISFRNFAKDKIISKVFADDDEPKEPPFKYQLGESREAKVPRNQDICYTKMYDLILKYNPRIYTGPDYMGAQSSVRYVNALFPARFNDSDLIIADLYEIKALDPLETDSWQINKEVLRKMADSNKYNHIYSCGKMHAFIQGKTTDSIDIISDTLSSINIPLESKKFKLLITDYKIPQKLEENGDTFLEVSLKHIDGKFFDQVNFWNFENVKNKNDNFHFIDYLTVGSRNGFDVLDDHLSVKEKYNVNFIKDYPKGTYNVFYGVGDLLQAREVLLGTITIN